MRTKELIEAEEKEFNELMGNKMTEIKHRQYLRVGMKVNNFVILESAGMFDGQSDERPQWKVRCDCGNIRTLVNRYIKRQKNCGVDCGLRGNK